MPCATNPRLWAVAAFAVLAAGCGQDEPYADTPPDAANIFAPLGEAVPFATADQLAVFERGRAVTIRRFTPATGLGPDFNVTFCGACHERPVPGGSAGRYRNFLLIGQELSDGSFTPTGINGIQSQYTLSDIGRHLDAENTNRRALRNPIPFFGVGLLAEIQEEAILKYADPDDLDGDGISGRPNYDRGFVGRFGRKAQTVSIEGFIRGPLFNHAGITTDPLSEELKAELPVPSASIDRPVDNGNGTASLSQKQAAAPAEPTVDDDGVADPELAPQDLFDLVSFSMLLAAPQPDAPTAESEAGQALFEQVGCGSCHVRALQSKRGMIPAYSDLLLHDMGDELADGIRMGEASGREFRTQPLWGLAATGPYLHDGSADTVHEAIAKHGGEGAAVRDAYLALSADDQALIATFLMSLGGAKQASTGLVPVDAPLIAAGEYGAPDTKLSSTEAELFRRGREVFDRDMAIGDGLGARFNGDSCRACHFEPVIGGAGTADVDVSRQGIVDAAGAFVSPVGGTIAHRHGLTPERPAIDPKANVFELRQTPPLFGLGLVDDIPEATILALQDPDDADQDGISGRAHVLPDGRVGRLGWKADVPSLAEFARDGLTNELGLTVPTQEGLTFGLASDSDGAPDPEATLSDIDALVFFMQRLAPPPRTSTQPDLEKAGEAVFASVGCASCHVPELETAGGVKVPLYSDLLLHEIKPTGSKGIVSGQATMLEFRTSPLWGLAKSAPYMHNGRAFTVEQAILEHDGEATATRKAFEALSAADRKALLAFLHSL